MNKNYIKSGLLLCSLLLILATLSCKKQLVLSPYNQVPANQAFNTKSDFDNAIRGVYRMMLAPRGTETYASYYGGADYFSFVGAADILSDNTTRFSFGRGSASTFHNLQASGNSTTYFFQDGYAIIRAANAVLDNIGNLKSDSSAKNYQGQALAVRAMVYFDMMRIFAKTPTNASATDLGVPLVLKVTDFTDRPKRDVVTAVYAQIENDLIAAASGISASNSDVQMNKAAVYALLSRVYLYEAKYPQCIIAANSSLALNADPASIATFPSIWNDASEAGVLFKLKVTPTFVDNNGGSITVGVAYGQTSAQGDKAEYVPAYDFAVLFKPTDVRTLSFTRPGFFSGDSITYIDKYAGKATGNQSLVDVKLLRVAEVYLNQAEAYYNTGDQANALKSLDMLRMNRYTNFVSGAEAGPALINAIWLERRLELAFEGDRFFDLKRRNLGIVRSTTNGDQKNGRGTPDLVTAVPAGDHRFQLPIDNNSINANTNLIQNPGY